jgi:hypothetical protein
VLLQLRIQRIRVFRKDAINAATHVLVAGKDRLSDSMIRHAAMLRQERVKKSYNGAISRAHPDR